MNERPIPEAALRDKNAVELLRVWIAEQQLQCSMKVGMYRETTNVAEGRAWGIILADVTRHLAMALEAGYSADRDKTIREIRDCYLKELEDPTSGATGEFV
ncbi:DUF5076 domain-containing protein [Bradyrhizobium sp. USDA 4451]